MVGKISKYDGINECGYIMGYDELTYFFHQNNVIGNTKLQEGDIVSFQYNFGKNEDQLPYAVNIIKKEMPGGSKAYKELYEIIRKLPENEKSKIPKSFMDRIKTNMDKTYEYRVEHIEDFENQKMLQETKELLAVVYREYLVSKEEKREISNNEKMELEKRAAYSVDVFEKSKKEESDHLELVVRDDEEKWFLKFINFFKNIFGK